MNIDCRLLLAVIQLIHLTKSKKDEDIRKLENEKDELFHNIQKGISDSIIFLRNDNDTESALGVTYLTELEKQMKELNDSKDFNNTNAQEARRRLGDTRRKKPKLNLGGFAYHLTTKSFDTVKIRQENKILVQNKLNAWIKQKDEEKAKIQEYKQKVKNQLGSATTEKCPRFGLGNLNSKNDVNAKLGNKKIKYPCCRKCCKRSYLGCL